MAALANQESGNPAALNKDTGAQGAWQILPSNWPRWAKEAGLSPNAPKTLENQRIVASHKIAAYKAALGDWRNVAIAWYASPNALHYSQAKLDHPQGKYPSINAYADSVMSRIAC